ncbi:pyridoxamine 5'-phosphate oxidase family protein [Natronomonas salsuginis]|nr:pyridoxamine 5'-phosphate oxidase family protein [Natronomonas salsuginis]
MGDPRTEMTDIRFAYSIGMTDDEVTARLRGEAVGVLALADGGDSYAIPVAYHYDGERIYVRLGLNPDSRKTEMLSKTHTACFLVYGADPLRDSWSIIATGPLSEIGPPTEFDDALVNALFVPLRVFDEPIENVDPTVFALEIESITGRRSTER